MAPTGGYLQNKEHLTGFIELTWPKDFLNGGEECDAVVGLGPWGYE